MYFYHVLARLGTYHGSGYLTYNSVRILKPGTIVLVSVREKTTLGVVIESVEKPSFLTKSVGFLDAELILPRSSMDLLFWLITYYPSPLGTVAQQFLPAS